MVTTAEGSICMSAYLTDDGIGSNLSDLVWLYTDPPNRHHLVATHIAGVTCVCGCVCVCLQKTMEIENYTKTVQPAQYFRYFTSGHTCKGIGFSILGS